MWFLIVLVSAVIVYVASPTTILEDATPPPGSELEDMKEKADEEQITEEQFFRCFTDISCHMGQPGRDAIFTCYAKVKPAEIDEYVAWFKDCTVMNITEVLKLEPNTNKFCTLDYDSQDEVNKFFLDQVITKIKTMCDNKSSGKCFRIQRGVSCATKLMEEKIASGECDTAVRKLENPPSSLPGF